MENISVANDFRKMALLLKKKKYQYPIAQVPSDGYSSRDSFSKVSIKWLEWYMFDQASKGNKIDIRYALNGGEMKIPGANYRADGNAEQTYASTTGKSEKKRLASMICTWLSNLSSKSETTDKST